MPKCGSQIILCDLPIRFDTYKGCSHACQYCFVNRNYDISKVKKGETVQALASFIKGNRGIETNWCDWNIPLHWGGVSDPFQPCEKIHKLSLDCLKVLAATKYPFIVSTKAVLPMEEPYFSLLSQCNCVFQVSMTCPEICNRFELGAPSFEERLKMVGKISKVVKRVVIRCQPYMVEYHKQIKEQIKRLAEAGVWGITFEALKTTKKRKGCIKLGADFVYPKETLYILFSDLKRECHKYGVKFLCSENRLRNMGDSLNCCGAEGLEGFKCFTYNSNHYLFDKENFKATAKMKEKGTAYCFKSLKQETVAAKYFKEKSLFEVMNTTLGVKDND